MKILYTITLQYNNTRMQYASKGKSTNQLATNWVKFWG